MDIVTATETGSVVSKIGNTITQIGEQEIHCQLIPKFFLKNQVLLSVVTRQVSL